MFAKLCAVIIALGLVACVLLAVRQQRVQTAHELAEVQRRVLQHDRMLLRLRAEIAARVTPARIDLASRRLGTLAHNGSDRFDELVRRETEPTQTADAER